MPTVKVCDHIWEKRYTRSAYHERFKCKKCDMRPFLRNNLEMNCSECYRGLWQTHRQGCSFGLKLIEDLQRMIDRVSAKEKACRTTNPT